MPNSCSLREAAIATTLFKEVTYSLSKLVKDIEMREIGLPDIQRPFVWKNNKVLDLFDFIFRGYPVGYLLFWATGHQQIGTDTKQQMARLLIVDGLIPVILHNLEIQRKAIAAAKKREQADTKR